MSGGGVGRRTVQILALIAVLAVGWVALTFLSVRSAAEQAQRSVASGDAIVVLGAAQYNGEPSPVLERRLITALELWEIEAASQVVTTGASQPGDTFTEGFAAFQYLRNAGISEDEIVVVVDGGDTYESLLATTNQLAVNERSVVLVTDAYHALRSKEIAEEVGLSATVVAAGDDTSFRRLARETVAVSLGRIISYRRISAFL